MRGSWWPPVPAATDPPPSTRGARSARGPRRRRWRPWRRRRPGRRSRHDHPGRLSPPPALPCQARRQGHAAASPRAQRHRPRAPVPPGTVVRLAADDRTDEAGGCSASCWLLANAWSWPAAAAAGAATCTSRRPPIRPRRTTRRGAGRGALDRAGAEADRRHRPGGCAERGQVHPAGRADRRAAEGRRLSRSRPPARTWGCWSWTRSGPR